MQKVIKIGNKEVRLDNNVAWTMEYRDQFGKDIMPILLPMTASVMESVTTVFGETGEDLTLENISNAINGRAMELLMPLFQIGFVDIAVNILWAMAKAADEDILPPKQWVREFDSFPLDIVLPAVYELAIKGFVSSKNLKRLRKIGTNLKNLQPSHSTTSSSQESSEA